MAKPPRDSDDYFYGYRLQDVIRIGEPGKQGKPGPSGKGVKGGEGDRGPPGSDGEIVVVTAGHILQLLGVATEATEINVEIEKPIVRR